jgi:hypothetical protein
MALVRTTLASACAIGDSVLVVASATGIAAGYIVRVDNETMLVSGAYVSGSTTVPVQRGQDGTRSLSHPVTAGVVVGAASDFPTPFTQTVDVYPIAGRARSFASYSASGAIGLPNAGSDGVAILNGTSVLAMTVAAPTKDMDGSMLWIASNGVAAHTVEFTGGLSGGGSSYDILTVNATAPVLLGPFMAVNSLWQAAVSVPMAGTVTNVTATLS